MGILDRFKDIMQSNINALLDKAEDPEKMIDQCIRNLNADLAKVKSETATIMAEENRCKRKLDECTAEMEKLQQYAIKALNNNNEDDAKKFLEKKSKLATEQTDLLALHAAAKNNSDHMKEMHDKLSKDIAELDGKRAAIKGKLQAAKTQEKMNKMMSSTNDSSRSISAFEKYEEKANSALDKAQAMADLSAPNKDSIDDLMDKYDDAPTNSAVDDELAMLKAQLGK